VRRITVLGASPGDVAEERHVVKDTIDHLNQAALLGESTKLLALQQVPLLHDKQHCAEPLRAHIRSRAR
jgi:hypothetical protein